MVEEVESRGAEAERVVKVWSCWWGGGGGELCVRGTPTQVTWLPSPGSWGLGRFGETWALNSRLLLGWTMILMTKKETWAEKQTGGAG